MKEKTENRICTVCQEERRTTVREEEESIYICEQCLRTEVRDDWLNRAEAKKLAKWTGWIILIIIFVVGYFIGKLF